MTEQQTQELTISSPLRSLKKMQTMNDGNRSLFESSLPGELPQVLRDWKLSSVDAVLIGGMAFSFYCKPRYTQDLGFLFLSRQSIPDQVQGFTRHRSNAFQHNGTHVEVEVLSPEFVLIPQAMAQKVFDTAVVSDGIKIASRSGLVALKLIRLKLQDQADIVGLIISGPIDLTGFSLTQDQLAKYDGLIEQADREREADNGSDDVQQTYDRITPGEYLRDDVRTRFGVTQDRLADALGVSRYSVNQIENGRRAITAEMALRLARVTGTTPELWLDMQRGVDLHEARHKIGDLVNSLETLSAGAR